MHHGGDQKAVQRLTGPCLEVGTINRGFNICSLFQLEDRKQFEVLRNEEGLRLDLFLQKRMAWMSRAAIQRLILSKSVQAFTSRLQRIRLKCSTRLVEGDRILVTIPQDAKDLEEARQRPPLSPMDILYEDASITVVNKPAGVPVHPVGMNLHRTVLTALHHRYRRPDDPERDRIPSLVHRLDLETSGVLLVAKDQHSLKDLAAQFRGRRVKKEYIAVLYGILAEDRGEVDLPIGPDERSRVPYKRAVQRETGQKALTRFEVLDRGNGLTRVRLVPLTGRKHQLRVHMAALGHPVVGDKIYGPDEKHYFKARVSVPTREDLEELLLPRQALHAFRLGFRHPLTGEFVRFEAPCPREFERLLAGESGSTDRSR